MCSSHDHIWSCVEVYMMSHPPSPSPPTSTSTRSPHVTTIKKDYCTSIGSQLSLSLLRVRMVVSLPFPVLFKVKIRLRMNLERCPLEIKLIILLQVIQDKINMFQTWDNVSAFLSKGIFSQVNHWFVFFSWPISRVTIQRTKLPNPQVDQSHDWQKIQAVRKSTQAFGKFFVLLFFI